MKNKKVQFIEKTKRELTLLMQSKKIDQVSFSLPVLAGTPINEMCFRRASKWSFSSARNLWWLGMKCSRVYVIFCWLDSPLLKQKSAFLLISRWCPIVRILSQNAN